MKRFLIDGVLIILLVAIGSSLNQYTQVQSKDMQAKLNDFETKVELHSIVGQESKGMALSQVQENKAGQLGSTVSEFVIEVVGSTLNLVSTLFQDFTQ